MGEVVITYLMPILAVLGIGALLREVIKLNAERAARRENVSGDERSNLREDVKFLREEISVLRKEIDILNEKVHTLEDNAHDYKEEIAARNSIFWDVSTRIDNIPDEELRDFIKKVLDELREHVHNRRRHDDYTDTI